MNNGLISVVNDAVDPIDPAIAVSMIGDIVVLSPRGRLDLDGSAELAPAELLFRTGVTPPNGVPLPVTHPTIGVIAPGCVRLSSSRGHWTNSRRLGCGRWVLRRASRPTMTRWI